MTLHLVDHTRTITLPGGQVMPRPVTTIVRYPTLSSRNSQGVSSSHPARKDGPFPVIVFGHGFDFTPSFYARLLRYWTSAGFVVASPIFPLEQRNAPGGANEDDLPNQPQDMRFVIANLLHLEAGPLSGLINRHEIAVAGHSDGGDTALALAYDASLRDSHIQAAVILSGAEIPMLPAFRITGGGPPLLATQGTADTINLPSATAAFFDSAPPPKYLLQLLGASHLGPYATNRVELGVVERVTTAFLQNYLYHDRAAGRNLLRSGDVPRVATLQVDR
jgi:pimeloyl-ACP methyl ester carboxylesterase